MPKIIVSCHQPNFMPWLGFFGKILLSDVCVLLDDVQFTKGKSKHNWTSRVRIYGTEEPKWISVPVIRAGEGRQAINEVRIDPTDKRWRRKVIRTIEGTYRKSEYFDRIFPSLSELIEEKTELICEMNVRLIAWICDLLNLGDRIAFSSSFPTQLVSNERLIYLTKKVGGSIYLAGNGASEYQVDQSFRVAGLEIWKTPFSHPVYPQSLDSKFQPGLSTVDCLFWVGPEKTRELLECSVNFSREAVSNSKMTSH